MHTRPRGVNQAVCNHLVHMALHSWQLSTTFPDIVVAAFRVQQALDPKGCQNNVEEVWQTGIEGSKPSCTKCEGPMPPKTALHQLCYHSMLC